MPVEAYAHPDVAERRPDHADRIVRRVIILLVEAFRLRDMHHALHAEHPALGVNDQGGVIASAVRLFEVDIRAGHDPLRLACLAYRLDRRVVDAHRVPGGIQGSVRRRVLREERRVLDFREHNHIGVTVRRLGDQGDTGVHIAGDGGTHTHLCKRDSHGSMIAVPAILRQGTFQSPVRSR